MKLHGLSRIILVLAVIFVAAAILFPFFARENTHPLESRLMEAARDGNVANAVNALVKGANPNFVDHRGMTPLAEASWYGHDEIIRILLNRHAQPTSVALKYAVIEQRTSIVKLLIVNGADCRSAEADKLLKIAQEDGDVQVAQMLRQHGAVVRSVERR